MPEIGDSAAFDTSTNAPYADPAPPSAIAIDEDLYCLGCGYNLRGLCGDPVRCPECGELNDRTELGIPQPVIKAALKQMETAPTVCVGCLMLFLLFVSLTVITFTHGAFDVALVLAGLSLACVVAWPIARSWVRQSFSDQNEWPAMLGEFHVAGVLSTLWYPMLLVFAFVSDRADFRIPGVFLLIVLALGAVLLMIGLRIYRKARGRILVMKRASAVRIAQQILSKTVRARQRS